LLSTSTYSYFADEAAVGLFEANVCSSAFWIFCRKQQLAFEVSVIDTFVSLSHVLAFLDSYKATENIISFWFNKLDEDTKRKLSHFSKYAVEYRKKTGALLNNCFDDFEK
jgi:uncharacterized protein YccT (UPF0319 family)